MSGLENTESAVFEILVDTVPPNGPDHDRERTALQPVADRYAFWLNDYYARLIDWDDPNDPIRQLVVPRTDALDEYGR